MHCTQCGAEVPAGAKFCPECGAKAESLKAQPARGVQTKPPTSTADAVQGCLILAVIIAIVLFTVSRCTAEDPQQAAATAAADAATKAKGFHCLSAWDGSNRSLVDQVTAGLRDPKSFEHAETRITPEKDGKHLATMQYRARNGFGGMNAATAIATVDHATCDATVISSGE